MSALQRKRLLEAHHVSSASVTIMEQPGHFPMSENPEQFRRHIAPAVGHILRQSSSTQQGEHA